MSIKSLLTNSVLSTVLKVIFFLTICTIIYVEVFQNKDTNKIKNFFFNDTKGVWAHALLLSTFALVFFNWGIEASKWRFLIYRLQPLSFWRSIKAVCAGTALGLLGPNRVGEFLGRVICLEPELRVKASFATIMGSVAQFVVTLVFGVVGLLIANEFQQLFSALQSWMLLMTALLVVLFTLYFYFNTLQFAKCFSGISWLGKWRKKVVILASYTIKERLYVLLFSALRYAIFSTQFLLLLFFFDIDVNFLLGYAFISIIYLVTTLVPTAFLGELGVRETVAVFVLKSHAPDNLNAFAPSFLLWCINLLFPAVLGGLFLLGDRVTLFNKPK